MFIDIYYKPGQIKKTKSSLKKLGIFSSIETNKGNIIKLKTIENIDENNRKEISFIRKQLDSISTIKYNELLLMQKTLEENRLIPDLHIFLDIDDTLTRNGLKQLDSNVNKIFDDLKKHNCTLYLCSGRAMEDVDKLRELYATGNYAIAENGGIIIGIGEKKARRGTRDEPQKVINYLKIHNIEFEYDHAQHPRFTEIILLKKSISQIQIKAAIKKSKAKAECHASKNTYHISKAGVNKGTAIYYLKSREQLDLDSENHRTIGIGDSGLDMSMFEYCNAGYFVGKPNRQMDAKIAKLGKKITKVPSQPEALSIIYKKLFPSG